MEKYIYMKRIILGLLSIMMFSCAKDKGNYDYIDINKIAITTEDSVFVMQQLQELVIKPKLTESIQNTGDTYSYQWTVYPVVPPANMSGIKEEDPKPIVLSEDKDLKSVIKLSPNSYYLQYTVTNTKTGLKAIKRYNLTVNGAFYEGWLVVNNVLDKGRLSFIRKDNQSFFDPIKDINGLELEGKALKAYSGVIDYMSAVYVFTDKTSYRFDADDFNLKASESDMFVDKTNFTDPFYTINFINTDQYIINGGSVYATISEFFGTPGKFSTAFGGEDVDVFPYFLGGGSRYYNCFYDNKHKRFVFADYNSRVIRAFSPIPTAVYDITNVGKTMVAADLGMNGIYYTIMKDSQGYHYYAFNPNVASPADLSQSIHNSPDIDKATGFAASSSLQHLYYTTDRAIYLYDILANTSRKVYEFTGNKKIKDIKMYKYKGYGSYKDPLYNKRLVVATYDGANGEVFYFDLEPTGDLVGQSYVQSFGGFGDIVQLNYRNPNEI